VADFRVWGTITQLAPRQFVVVVSAVLDPPKFSDEAEVRTAQAASRHEAEQMQESMMIELGKVVRGRGHRVIDVEN